MIKLYQGLSVGKETKSVFSQTIKFLFVCLFVNVAEQRIRDQAIDNTLVN